VKRFRADGTQIQAVLVLGLAMFDEGGIVPEVHPTVYTVERSGVGMTQHVSFQRLLALQVKTEKKYREIYREIFLTIMLHTHNTNDTHQQPEQTCR
jgi:hypothetical protein